MKYVLLLAVLTVGCTSKPADRQQRVEAAKEMTQAFAGFGEASAKYAAGKTPTKTKPVHVDHY